MAGLTYLIPVGETISTAWNKVKGTKGSIWAAIFLLILITIGLRLVQLFIVSLIPGLEWITNAIIQLIDFLMQIGLLYIGISRALDLPFSFRMMFRPFEFYMALKIIGTYLLQVLIMIPFAIILMVAFFVQAMTMDFSTLLAILIGFVGIIGIIYITLRMYLAMAFVLDRGVMPWPAIKLSFLATRSNFWRLVAIIILELLIILVSLIPLGIGLIWTAPFVYILYGVVYRNLSFNLSNQS